MRNLFDTDKPYALLKRVGYKSPRYNKTVFIAAGRTSDGASGGKDLTGPVPCTYKGKPFMASLSWWVHDELCEYGTWHDGTPVTNWKASMVLRDILKEEGHGFRARTWTWATFLFGGNKLEKV